MLALGAAPIAAQTLPTGGTVTAGTAQITSTGQTMTVTQGSDKLALDWQSFNIGKGHSVHFVQPSSSAVALNRVLGNDVSVIQGALTANGQVFLVNPNGVLFTPTAQVNTASLVASTLQLSTADFLAGNYQFSGASRAAVDNQGRISADRGGSIALVAARIVNSGTLNADSGSVLLGAGSSVKLDLGGPVPLEVQRGALDAQIAQGGAIRANDGLVYLSARAADALAHSVIQHSGVIEANSLHAKGGRVVLEADQIQLQSGSRTEAQGASGGGSVLAGGDWQGSGTLRQATSVTLEAGAQIDASATGLGNGGKVVLWSDVHDSASTTRAHGQIFATGGAQGGDGGKIETSGHRLDVAGITANASATPGLGGVGGTWLLDPYNITISSAATTAGPGFPNWTSAGNSSVVHNSDIEAQLNSGTSVTIATGAGGAELGNIVVAANIAKTAGGDATLTLQAHNAIEINSGVSISSSAGALDVMLRADADASNGGYIWLGKGNTPGAISPTAISTNGGALTLSGGTDPVTGFAQGASTSNSNGVTLDTVHLSTAGGNIVVRGKSGVSVVNIASSDQASSTNTDGIRLHGASVIDSGAGTIDFTGVAVGNNGSSNAIETNFTGYTRITSAATNTTAIRFSGDATQGTSSNGWGTFLWGTNTSGILLAATGAGGGIALSGQGRNTSYGGGTHLEPNAFVLAAGGPISIYGEKGAVSTYEDIVINSTVGYAATLPAGFGIASPVTASNSHITLTADSLSANRVFGGGTFSGSAVQSGGTLTIAPRSNGKVMAVQTTNPGASVFWINPTSMFGASGLFKTGFDKLVFGNSSTGNLTLNNYSFNNDTEIHTSGNAVLGAVTIGNGKALSVNITGSGSITDTGAVNVAQLLLNGSTSAVTLDSTTNSIGTVAGNVASLTLVNNAALTVGTVAGTSGIQATGDVSIATRSGNLTLAQDITTTASGSSAIVLNAGSTTAAGTASGGNLVVSGSPSLTTGAGGRATLYSGSVTGSTGLTALVGSGSGRFRYNSNASSTGYNTGTAALGSGLYAIYRERPLITVTANNASKNYDGVAYAGGNGVTVGAGLVNGDSSAMTTGTLGYGGTAQGALNVGNSYTIIPSGYTSDLGYGYSYVNGTLTIDPAVITIVNISGSLTGNVSKVYDGSTDATLSPSNYVLSGFASGEGASVTKTSGSYDNPNAGDSKLVTVTLGNGDYAASGSTDLSNYALPTSISGNVGSISPKALVVSGSTVANKTYDGTTAASVTAGTLSGLVGNESLTLQANASFDSQNAGTRTASIVYTLADGSGLASNYTVANASQGATISPRALSVAGAVVQAKTYDGTTSAQVIGGTLSGLVDGESLSLTLSASLDSKNAGLRNATLHATLGDASGLAANYTLADSRQTTTVSPLVLRVTGLLANPKVYDASTSASLSGNASIAPLAGDSVALQGGVTAQFADPNAGTGKTVQLASTLSLTGTDAANYQLQQPANLSADITARPITVTVADQAKTVGAADPALTYSVTSGSLVGGDSLHGAVTRSAGEATGRYAIQGAGLSHSNYQLTVRDGVLTISPQPLTVPTGTPVTGGANANTPPPTLGGAGLSFVPISAEGATDTSLTTPAPGTAPTSGASAALKVFVVDGGINLGSLQATTTDDDNERRKSNRP